MHVYSIVVSAKNDLFSPPILRCIYYVQRVEEETQALRLKQQQQEALRLKQQQQEEEMERHRVELLARRKALEEEAVRERQRMEEALRERQRIEEEDRARRVALSVKVTHPIPLSTNLPYYQYIPKSS